MRKKWTSGGPRCPPTLSTPCMPTCAPPSASTGRRTKITWLRPNTRPRVKMALPRSVSLPFLVVSAAVVATSYRLLQAVDRYSVNVLFWDQWDFYTPLFSRASLWRIFTWQHGPHREGIGLVIDKFVLDATRWNSRAEVLFMVAVLIAATLAALKLKERLFGSISYGDLAIPCLLLTFAQMEALVGAPNPSYSAVPELLIALYCLAGTLPRPAVR